MKKTEKKGSEIHATFRYSRPLFFVGLGLVITFCLMPMLKTGNLHSTIFDLGIFDSSFWNTAFDFNWSRLFFGHAQPLIALGAIFYKFWSSSVFLVFLQSFLLISGFSFLFFFSSNILKLPPIILPSAFFLYFPLWYNALFDFHMDHLAVPLLFLFYYGCSKKKWWAAGISAMVLALVKEPYALETVFCGVYLCVCQRRFGWGLITLLFGAIYFYVATCILIPNVTFGIRGALDADAFSWLGRTPFEMLIFIFTHPVTILMEIFSNSGKMIYCFTLFGALAFIPFFSPLELIPAIPILGISLLSRVDNYYCIGHHYAAGLIAPMIVGFALGYPKAESVFLMLTRRFVIDEKARKFFVWGILGWMVFMNILISPSPISRLFWTNKVWSYGFEAYIPVDRDNMIKDALKRYVPADPNVPVSSQNTLNWSYLAHRKYYFAFPDGVTEPVIIPDFAEKISKKIWAEYVIIDLKRPWFLVDRGCGWQAGEPVILSDEDVERLGLKENPGPLKWESCASQEFRKDFLDAIVETKKVFIDSVLSMAWADYRKGAKKAKVHVGFNVNQAIPQKLS